MRIRLALAAVTAVAVAGWLAPNAAQASPLHALKDPQLATEGLDFTQKVQWCFYVDGWNGPGFYRCGFRHRRGEGWHGKYDSRGERGERREHSRRDSRYHSRHESRAGTK
jgi:hypothetical protein